MIHGVNIMRFLDWWERSLVAGLCLSIAQLGVGRIEFFSGEMSVSAWSVSRTIFFFWLAYKLFAWARGVRSGIGLAEWNSLLPLLVFFLAVTVSLLPDFRRAGDYRYFFFGCAHAVMLIDLFSGKPQERWLPPLLGLLPLLLVVRGLTDDPSVLNLSLEHRFGYPVDHPNTAGYLFAMSVPLGVYVAMMQTGWRCGLSAFSCAAQTFALVLTFSRGAWLGWTTAMLYFTLSVGKWKELTVMAVLALGCVFISPSIQERIASVSRPHDDLAMRERLQRLTSSLQLGTDNPILGIGYGRGRLREALPRYFQGTLLEGSPVLHTHNVYVEIFVGTGVVGLLAFLWLLADTLVRLLRAAHRSEGAARYLGLALAASWIAALVAGLGDIPFFHHETRIFFFTLLALAHMYAAAGANQGRVIPGI
jgi:O-antigen ligase